jgi:hypothetical protein
MERGKEIYNYFAVVVVDEHLEEHIYFLLEKTWTFVLKKVFVLYFLLHPIQSGVEIEDKGQAGCLRKLKFDSAGKTKRRVRW